MSKVVEKTMGNGVDNKHLNIIDYAPERSIRVYPYVAFRANDSKAIIENQAVSIVGLNQTDLEANGIKTLIDENGKNYIEVLGLRSKEGKIDISKPTSSVGVQIKYETSLDAITQTMPTKRRMKPIFVTVDEPFNKEQYEAGNQPVFLMGTILPMDDFNDEFPDYDEESATQFKLTNVTVIEQQFQVARMLFEEIASGEIDYSLTIDGKQKYGLAIDLDAISMTENISGSGKIKGIDQNVDFNSYEKMTIMKSTPVETRDGRLTMFMDWFDYDMVMPYFIAEKFAQDGGLTLEQLKDVTVNNVKYFTDAEVQLIRDMLSVSWAFATQFATFKRITDTTKNDYGKLDPNQVIGSQDLKLSALENKDPIKVVDGIFEKYLRDNAGASDREQLRAVKAIINALARYIYSSYTIGKGQNSFNEVYLPWYLNPLSSITLSSSTKDLADGTKGATAWNLGANINFKLGSRFFNVGGGKISLKDNVELSKVKLIQTDRKLTLPTLPASITPITKLPLAGDIRTNSSDDLKYYFYLPIKDDATFAKLFLNDPVVSEGNTNVHKTFDTSWTDLGKSLPTNQNEIQQYVVNDYSKQYTLQVGEGQPVPNIQFESAGNIEEKISNTIIGEGGSYWTINIENNQIQKSGKYSGVAEYVVKHIKGNESIFNPSQESKRQAIAYGLNIPVEYVFSVDNWEVSEISDFPKGGIKIDAISYKLKLKRFAGAIVLVNGRSTSVSVNRETLFDKVSWSYFMKDYLGIGGQFTIHIVEPHDSPIERIDEIFLGQVWGDNIKVYVGGNTFNIPAFNKDDETIGYQKILFT